jgi:2'-5' RNA ligase
MRLFVAVAVPAAVASELEAAVAPLRPSWPALRWTGRDAWHLTLAFLGEVNEVVAVKLAHRMESAAAGHSHLALSLHGSGAFPGTDRARVLWTGVHGERDRLSGLARSVAAGARRAGAPPTDSGRRFRPHLTLARSRAPVDVRALVAELSGYAGAPWTAQEIYLIRSRPDSQPRYETLGTWPLRPPPAPRPPPQSRR